MRSIVLRLIDDCGRVCAITLISLAVAASHARAQEASSDLLTTARVGGGVVKFGGPESVARRIEDDVEPREAIVKERALQPWFDWKESLLERSGVSFGLDYSNVFLWSDPSNGTNDASSGMLRFYGSWEAVGRGTANTGSLVWKIENRHRYSDVAASAYGLSQLGYAGFIAPPFSDQGTRWTNLYWRQRLNQGRATVLGGYLDVTDYVDVWLGATPWTGFINLVFSTGSASMFLPNDATLGAAGGTMLGDKMFLIGSVANAYTDSTDPFDGSFDRFFNDHQYFSTIELGWTGSQDQIYTDNTHVTLWHVDNTPQAGALQGWGFNFSHVKYLSETWMPFVRGGYADDGGSLLQKSISGGFLYQKSGTTNQLGIGLNWGEPNESTFAPGLESQITMETFYRIQITQQFALTPSIQYLKDPALNPVDDSLWVVGLRGRFAL